MKKSKVSVFVEPNLEYPNGDFNPPVRYPEYPYLHTATNPANRVYEAVRQSFLQLGLDVPNYGTPQWNPLAKYIKRGSKVVLKPNFVIHTHPDGKQGLLATVTNPALVRAVIDYVYIATGPEGKIDLVDAPLDVADFELVLATIGAQNMLEDLKVNKGIHLNLTDLRRWRIKWDGSDVKRFPIYRDPAAYVKVDLGTSSELLKNVTDKAIKGYRSTASFFEDRRIGNWHNKEHNYYSLSKIVLESDVFINMPKMKAHKKAGVTLSLKNLIGITDAKDTLPHHRIGRPSTDGDEIPDRALGRMRFKAFLIEKIISNPRGLSFYKLLQPIYSKLKRAGIYGREDQNDRGEWYGNDTIWRTVLDLNKILLYADENGNLHDSPRRVHLSVIDGIVAGEGNGPLKPKAVHCGCVVVGDDPVAADVACTKIMGFDWQHLRTYKNIQYIDKFALGNCDPEWIDVVANDQTYADLFRTSNRYFAFRAPDGWQGAIEL